jgi:hypothetical protein
VHLCYVDDSGKNDVVILTGLLIPGSAWNVLLHDWLEGRRRLTEEWGVRKHVELHAKHLARGGKGRYCETMEQERAFSSGLARSRAIDILLQRLGDCSELTVTTVASHTDSSAAAYAHFINHLDHWAAKHDTHVMVVLDGQEGPIDTTGMAEARIGQQREAAHRNAVHYRNVHRGLDLAGRRIVEDPVVLDSRHSQLIQAADLTAYAAYQHLWNDEVWPQGGKHGRPKPALAKSHHRLSSRWLEDSEHGIHWAGSDDA